MFSGCRPRAKRAFRGVTNREKTFNTYYIVSFLRHLWSAHVDDRKRNLYLESRSQHSQFHAQRNATKLLDDAVSGGNLTGEQSINLQWSSGSRLQHRSPEVRKHRISELETFGGALNDTELVRALDPESHGQSNQLPLNEVWRQVDSASNSNLTGKSTVSVPPGSERSKLQIRSTKPNLNDSAKLQANVDPKYGMVLGKIMSPERHSKSNQRPSERPSSFIESRTALEIERDDIWRRKWQRRRTAERLTRAARLRKGALAYDWKPALELTWREDTPVSGLRRRGRLFRLKHVGGDSGVNTPRVEEPSTWTKVGFDSYVHELARVKPLPGPVAEALNSGPGMKVESRSTRERGAVLHELMHRRLSHAFIEPEVCNVAIHFLTRHQMIAKARSILFLMEHLNLHITPSTFNLFLRAAVHQQDLATFTRILRIMKARGIRRDSNTLMLLIWCLRSRKRKTEVIRKMEMAGTRLKNRQMRRDLIAATIKQDIAQDLESGGDPLEFIRRMRRTHKIGWMSNRIGNIILDQVCKRLSLPAGLNLLDPLLAEGFRPDIVTLRTPLFLALNYRAPEKVATILDLFSSKFNLHPDADTYRKMWYLAWQRRWLNVSALIFVAACINGAVTTDMRNMVLLSLKINNDLLRVKSAAHYGPAHTTTNTLHNPDIPLRRRLTPKLPGQAARVYLSLMGSFVLDLDPWEAHPRKAVHSTMMQMIRALARGRFQLKYSLAYNFREAYRLDSQWKIFEGRDVQEKLWDPWPIALELKDEAKGGGGSVVSYFLHSTTYAAPRGCDLSYWMGR